MVCDSTAGCGVSGERANRRCGVSGACGRLFVWRIDGAVVGEKTVSSGQGSVHSSSFAVLSRVRGRVALSNSTLQFMGSAAVRQGVLVRAGAACVLVAMTVAAHAQFQRWYDLSEQAEKLHEAGNDAVALPLEQQAEQVAEATGVPNDRHVALSSNMLGILDMDLEKFSDAETNRVVRSRLIPRREAQRAKTWRLTKQPGIAVSRRRKVSGSGKGDGAGDGALRKSAG